MAYLFDASGKQALAQLKPGSLLVFDYDGTLSPMVDEPHRAITPVPIKDAIAALSNLAQIAVVTGRNRDDIPPRLGIMPRFMLGNHGLEGMPGRMPHVGQAQRLCQMWAEQLAQAQLTALDPGIYIEHKKTSIAMHYRLSSNPDAALAYIQQACARLDPVPRTMSGHSVLNLLPAFAPDKWEAILTLVEVGRFDQLLFIGDDETDEVVFRATLPDWLTIRVGPVTQTAARFYINDQSEVVTLLKTLNEQWQGQVDRAP